MSGWIVQGFVRRVERHDEDPRRLRALDERERVVRGRRRRVVRRPGQLAVDRLPEAEVGDVARRLGLSAAVEVPRRPPEEVVPLVERGGQRVGGIPPREMPLPDHAGRVAFRPERLGQRDLLVGQLPQGVEVLPDPGLVGEPTGLQRGSSRRAFRRGPRALKAHSAIAQTIDGRGGRELPVRAERRELVGPDVVEHDDEHVAFGRRRIGLPRRPAARRGVTARGSHKHPETKAVHLPRLSLLTLRLLLRARGPSW